MAEDDLEALRQRRIAELQRQAVDQQAEQEEQAAFEFKKDAVLKQFLTQEARSRLSTLKLGNPKLADQVEKLLLYLAQSGQVQRIDDLTLKKILAKISGRKREITIKRK